MVLAGGRDRGCSVNKTNVSLTGHPVQVPPAATLEGVCPIAAVPWVMMLPLIVALGREFDRRGMTRHVVSLRLYYRRAAAGRLDGWMDRYRITWTPALVERWMKLLRVPPFQDFYPVKKRMEGCEACTTPGAKFTQAVFPGGYLIGCRCRKEWLEFEGGLTDPSTGQ